MLNPGLKRDNVTRGSAVLIGLISAVIAIPVATFSSEAHEPAAELGGTPVPEFRENPAGQTEARPAAAIARSPQEVRPAMVQRVAGQSSALGAITGTVTDAAGEAVARATIILSTPEGRTKDVRTTSNSGAFVFRGVADGQYTLQVFAPGFGPSRLMNVAVTQNANITHNVTMDIGSVAEVRAANPAVGALGGFVAERTPSAITPGRIRIGGNVAAANLVDRVLPFYPQEAREAKIQGVVILDAVINREGRVDSLKVIAGHPLLVQSAVDAVKQWRYNPTMIEGAPVEVQTTITVTFSFQQ
jgi:TonB family protein